MRFAKIFLIVTFVSSSASSQISNFVNINYRYLIPQFETKKFKNFDRTKSRKYFKSNLGASNNIMLEIEKEERKKREVN